MTDPNDEQNDSNNQNEPTELGTAMQPAALGPRPRRRRAVAGRDTGPPADVSGSSDSAQVTESADRGEAPSQSPEVDPTRAAVNAVRGVESVDSTRDAATSEAASTQVATSEAATSEVETGEPATRPRRRRRTAAVTFGVGDALTTTTIGSPVAAVTAVISARPEPEGTETDTATETATATDTATDRDPEAEVETAVRLGNSRPRRRGGSSGTSPFAVSFQTAPEIDPLADALADEVAEDLAEDLAAGLTDDDADEATALVADDVELDESDDRPRRRRRGRRGRGRARLDDEGGDGNEDAEGDEESTGRDAASDDSDAGTADGDDEDSDGDVDESGEGSSPSSRRRRRRRRTSSGSAATGEASEDDPPNTVIHVRQPRERQPRDGAGRDRDSGRDRSDRDRGDGGGREGADGVRGVNGSTRLEAKRQRRRDGRGDSRRRPPVLTEAEFLARREAVDRQMVVRRTGDRTQIAVLEDGVLVEHYVTKSDATSYAGNIYLGKVQNVLSSMEAAFVDIGKGRNAVLYAGEVSVDPEVGKPQRIEQALKSGQSVLVQVTKDPVGHKGARLTSQISLPGRYLVYVPEGPMTGISRKLPDVERSRLKSILKRIVPEDAGVIIRTAAEGATEEDLTADVERLQAQWKAISAKAVKDASKSPVLLHGEPDLAIKTVRDLFNEDISALIIDGEGAFEELSAYVEGVAPDLLPRVHRWSGEGEIFASYRVQEGLAKALERKVHLPSGGSLVIDRTEALVAIDVNTGRFTGTGGSNLEETVTRNNLEAAEEIARQLRLRDIGGMVVIDFIDMVLESNRELVLRRLIECLGRDRTKHQVSEVTSLGLVQLTRKRVGQGLLESFSEPCPTCGGRGVVLHPEGYDANAPRPPKLSVPSPAAVAAKVASTPRPAPVVSDESVELSAESLELGSVELESVELESVESESVAPSGAEAEADVVVGDPGDSAMPQENVEAAQPAESADVAVPDEPSPAAGRRRRGGRKAAVRDVTTSSTASTAEPTSTAEPEAAGDRGEQPPFRDESPADPAGAYPAG